MKETIQDFKRKQIVLIASAMFLKQGIEAVKMTDIAKECGIGVASLYRYFGTKTQIVLEAGTLLWKDLEELFRETFFSESYESNTGIEQLEVLLGVYKNLYETHSAFLNFVGEFDQMMLTEKVSKEDLSQYEASIFDFYTVGDKAFEKGQRDGTIRKGLVFTEIYYPFTHAMMGMCQKFLKGPVLRKDQEITATEEIEQLIKMVIYYTKE